MALYLNTNSAYEDFRMLSNDEFFVDKSGIIEKVNKRLDTKNRYLCITKPRRFGKTSVLNMLGAYYGKACPSKEIFDKLAVSDSEDYAVHLNQYNIITLSMNDLPGTGNTYGDYINQFKASLICDIKDSYPDLKTDESMSLPKILAATGDRFIFIIDEWDYIFSHDLYPENQSDFLEFLRDLLKDKTYVTLAYMTGVLPIQKYSTGSALNMFKEYTMLNDPYFGEYFGFTETDIESLCSRQNALTFPEISEWYNGYTTTTGIKIYNPRSVICALEDGYCQSYWTRTGKMDEVLFFLKYNIGEVRDDIIKMVGNIPVKLEIRKEYTAGQQSPANRKEIYSAMIIYGLLSYHDGELCIPNKELMIEFENALEDDEFGYVAELVKNSHDILEATINKKEAVVALYLHTIHNSELPILQYNDENSLSCVVTLAYLAARNKYKIEREEKSGKGFADFIFYPRRPNLPGIIIELKAGHTPEDAIRQIKEREYCEKLKKEQVKNILAVGICYDTVTKEHACKIETI